MWELDIIINYKNRKYLFYIKESIISSANYNHKGIFAIIEKGNSAIMSMALIEPSTDMLSEINRVVAECIVFCEKEAFIHNLSLSCNPDYRNALVKTLVLIDISDDIEYVSRSININDKVINIHSYFNFKLQALKKKWQNLYSTLLPNGNISDDNVIDMLKSIIDSNSQETSVNISFSDNSYILKGVTSTIINAPTEADVIANLILLSPNKITLDKTIMSTDSLILLSYLFPNKICIQ